MTVGKKKLSSTFITLYTCIAHNIVLIDKPSPAFTYGVVVVGSSFASLLWQIQKASSYEARWEKTHKSLHQKQKWHASY